MPSPRCWGMANRSPQWRRQDHGHPTCHDRTWRRLRNSLRCEGARPAPQRWTVHGAAIGYRNCGFICGVQPDAQTQATGGFIRFSDVASRQPRLGDARCGRLRAQLRKVLYRSRHLPTKCTVSPPAGSMCYQPRSFSVSSGFDRGLACRSAAFAPRIFAATDFSVEIFNRKINSATPDSSCCRTHDALELPADSFPASHDGFGRSKQSAATCFSPRSSCLVIPSRGTTSPRSGPDWFAVLSRTTNIRRTLGDRT